jgi:hypothetical protein
LNERGSRVRQRPLSILGEELADDPVEQINFLEVDGMSGCGKYRQTRRGTHAFDEKGWIDTVVVLVPEITCKGTFNARSLLLRL